MNKVVIISTVGLIYDGITSVIVSYLEAMDKTDLEIYVVNTIKAEPKILDKIKNLGCKVVDLPSRKAETLSYFIKLTDFIKKNRINIVHAHGNSATLTIELLAGYLGGAKKRIAHSHNTKCNQVNADKLLRPFFYKLCTDSIACGNEAGRWLFKDKPFTVLKNGRDINKYAFSHVKRAAIRDMYSLEDSFVLGHVGGFFEQKNHKYVVKIFREFLKMYPQSKLFLIGDGPLKEQILKGVADIKDKVIFTGAIENVNDYLNACDGMLLPSLFEGLPLVAIEWQINGLPAILSDTITKDCKLTQNVKFDSLEQSPAIWAEDIVKMINENDREKSSEISKTIIREKGFDIEDNAKTLRDIYLS